MSTASISYSSLRNAAGEARDVAKKIDKYADSINSTVYKKLNNYEGSWTENITSARAKANAKISELRTEAGKYRDYADELDDLKTECESVDKAVKSKVSSLTASFKAAHGINNNVVINTISYFFTSIGNSSKAGRWLNEKTDQIDSGVDYLKQSIEDWYDYNGGKNLIKGIAVAVIEIAIAVLGVIILALGTVTGVWAVVAAVATVVGAIIAVVDGVWNICNEVKALGYADNDPATAKRLSDLNTVSDTLRAGSDNELFHSIANIWDGATLICGIIGFLDGAKNLLKNGYKWVKQTDFKKIFSKDFFVNIKDIGKVIKQSGLTGGKAFLADVLKNLKGEYFTFTNVAGEFNLVNTLKSIKNMLGIPKDLIKDGISFETIKKLVVDKIVLPGITLFACEGDKVVGYEVGPGGQMQMDFTVNTTIGKPVGLWKKGEKYKESFKELIDGKLLNLDISIPDVVKKLEQVQPIQINVPIIPVPDMRIGYTQVA